MNGPNHLSPQNIFGVPGKTAQKGFANPFLDNLSILYLLKTTEDNSMKNALEIYIDEAELPTTCKVSLGHTQNVNGCLKGIIWARCPNSDY